LKKIEITFDKERIKELIRGLKTLELRALGSILYLYGCRISEILGKLRKEQVVYEKDEDGEWLILKNIITLKRRKDTYYRTLPLKITEDERELVNYILDYIKTIPEGHILFTKTRRWAERHFQNHGIFPHFLRACRATHLANFAKPFQLQAWFGWKKVDSADMYVRQSQIILREMWNG